MKQTALIRRPVLVAIVTALAVTAACGGDSADNKPEGTEFINEVTLTLMRRQDSTFQHAIVVDPDGRGPIPWQVQQGSLQLVPNASYTATITLTIRPSPRPSMSRLSSTCRSCSTVFYTVDPEEACSPPT